MDYLQMLIDHLGLVSRLEQIGISVTPTSHTPKTS
jgi:hypothetical protein